MREEVAMKINLPESRVQVRAKIRLETKGLFFLCILVTGRTRPPVVGYVLLGKKCVASKTVERFHAFLESS